MAVARICGSGSDNSFCVAARAAGEGICANCKVALERTISIIKPDAVAKNVIGQIYSRF